MAGQAQIWSYTHVTLRKYVFFKDNQMILVSFSCIFNTSLTITSVWSNNTLSSPCKLYTGSAISVWQQICHGRLQMGFSIRDGTDFFDWILTTWVKIMTMPFNWCIIYTKNSLVRWWKPKKLENCSNRYGVTCRTLGRNQVCKSGVTQHNFFLFSDLTCNEISHFEL